MWIVVGLGNPGPEYENNRHNIGYMVLDALSVRLNISIDKKNPLFLFGRDKAGSHDVTLVKPLTFMNESGLAVKSVLAALAQEEPELLVVFDDLDLPVGAIRIRESGGSGGHRGMESIIKRMGIEDFVRLRAGIGRPPARSRKTEADYVLSDFKKSERKIVEEEIATAAEAIECLIGHGVTEAMNRYNS